MRSFVVLTALFAVGMCALLPGYNYNSGASFNHDALVGPAFAGSNNVPQVAGLQAPSGGQQSGQSSFGPAASGPSGNFGPGASGASGNFGPGASGASGNFGPGASGASGNFGPGSSGASGNFGPGASGASGNFGPGASGSSGNFGPGASGASGNFGPGSSGPSGNFGNSASPSSGSPAIAPQFPAGGFDGGFDSAAAANHEAPLITKQFFLHSAPEDHSSIGKTKHFVLGRAQKNYRVVFIKAPSDSNANVRLSAEYAPQEEKTVIYVLSQKEHELDVNDIATPAPTQPSKPEVFFIKYKSPEEAAHAQTEIQRQYDVLGGQSQVSDEGSAPVSDVSGALGAPNQSSQQTAPYLPPQH